MHISLLQCQSGKEVSANLQFIESQLKRLVKHDSKPMLVVLPECCLLFGGHEGQQLSYAAEAEHHPLKRALSHLAAQYQVFMVAGTIPVLAADERIYSRCYLFDDKGHTLGHYDKLHLFDVDVADNTQQYRESESFCPGDKVSVISTPFGNIGLAICYDLRFPDLFRAMRLAGVDIIALPAAFTKVTGAAHWQVLVQARAIENQCFMLASAQWGQHSDGSRETWGQSMIVDPWGHIVAEQRTGVGWVQGDISLTQLHQCRQAMPVMAHNRFVAPCLK